MSFPLPISASVIDVPTFAESCSVPFSLSDRAGPHKVERGARAVSVVLTLRAGPRKNLRAALTRRRQK